MPKADTEALYVQIRRRFIESGEWDRSATNSSFTYTEPAAKLIRTSTDQDTTYLDEQT